MATAAQWWVVAGTSYGSAPTYQYVQGTQAQAQALADKTIEVSSKPSVSGPYATKAAAEAAVQAKTVNTPNTSPDTTVPNVLTGIDAVGAFFNNLGNANTWVRVAKVLVGGVLLIVGLVHITGAGGAAADLARKVPVPI